MSRKLHVTAVGIGLTQELLMCCGQPHSYGFDQHNDHVPYYEDLVAIQPPSRWCWSCYKISKVKKRRSVTDDATSGVDQAMETGERS